MEAVTEVLRSVFASMMLIVSNPGDIDILSYNANIVECLAQNIYFESRNQDFEGKIAVGYVTLHRVNHKNYPNTVCDVVYEGPKYISWKGNEVPVRWDCQFTWYCDGKADTILLNTGPDKRAWEDSIKAAILVLLEEVEDPTGGATHYHNPRLSSPKWPYPITASIGEHLFQRLPHN